MKPRSVGHNITTARPLAPAARVAALSWRGGGITKAGENPPINAGASPPPRPGRSRCSTFIRASKSSDSLVTAGTERRGFSQRPKPVERPRGSTPWNVTTTPLIIPSIVVATVLLGSLGSGNVSGNGPLTQNLVPLPRVAGLNETYAHDARPVGVVGTRTRRVGCVEAHHSPPVTPTPT